MNENSHLLPLLGRIAVMGPDGCVHRVAVQTTDHMAGQVKALFWVRLKQQHSAGEGRVTGAVT